jgi:hypothetical protein
MNHRRMYQSDQLNTKLRKIDVKAKLDNLLKLAPIQQRFVLYRKNYLAEEIQPLTRRANTIVYSGEICYVRLVWLVGIITISTTLLRFGNGLTQAPIFDTDRNTI